MDAGHGSFINEIGYIVEFTGDSCYIGRANPLGCMVILICDTELCLVRPVCLRKQCTAMKKIKYSSFPILVNKIMHVNP